VEYPTFVQTATWTAREEEGRKSDDSITFNSKEGMSITADISLSYQLDPLKVPDFYVKFRSDDLNTFTHGYLRNVARDSFNEVASTYSVEDIYGPKKGEFLAKVRERLHNETSSFGISVQQLGFIETPRVPETYLAAMNAKVTATQAAQQAENELRKTQAEVAKRVADAEGDAKSQIARAEGAAEANRKLAASITPNLLENRRLDNQHDLIWRWNGQRPQTEINGGTSGLILETGNK
jgi:regulator of protease activity HflC (stomatin/prohibitin superfamily)